MKVLVLGAGVIGTTSAYFLAKQGHDVTVIDRQDSVAMETSHANAGCLSYGFTSPLASPGLPFNILKWAICIHVIKNINKLEDDSCLCKKIFIPNS